MRPAPPIAHRKGTAADKLNHNETRGDSPMSTAEDLGKLILMMNPYGEGAEYPMEPNVFVEAPSISEAETAGATTTTPSSAPDTRHNWIEMDTRYAGEWPFKGQPHNINRALRIAYRWP